MNLPIPTAPPAAVHEPDADDREPKTRRKLLFFDRAKVLLILLVILAFSVSLKHSNVPVLSWWETITDQLRAKTWVFVLMGLEILRQVHYLISERNSGYHLFWMKKVWGGWERFWGKRNPWLRYRLARAFRIVVWTTILMFFFAWLWGLSISDAFAAAPRNLLWSPFGDRGLPFFFDLMMMIGFSILQFVGIFWFMSRGGVDTYMPDEVRTRFADVWGQDKVLDKVRENIVFLDKPEEIESKGGHVPSGILLWGPPGTGKTLIAEAVAGETGRPYVFVDPGAFQAMFLGVGIMKVKALFRKLRKLSLRHGGVIVFFDEADSLGSRGGAVASKNTLQVAESTVFDTCNGAHYLSPSTLALLGAQHAPAAAPAVPPTRLMDRIVMGGFGGGGGLGTIQALLTELSGLRKPRGFVSRKLRSFLTMPPKQPPKYRILMMMATNLPDALDPALLRPGRVDRQYHVGYPNLEGRVKTIEGYLAKVRNEIAPAQIQRLATIMPSGTGASIKDIVNESLVIAIRKGRDYVTWPDMLEAKAFKTYGLSDGPAATTLEQWETAIHEGGHAVATYVLRKRTEIDVATIEQRGPVGGFVAWVPREERSFSWKADWENDIIVSLASLAAERRFFEGTNSAGVGGDLRNATGTVELMIHRAAMGGTLRSPDGTMRLTSVGAVNPDGRGPTTRDSFDAQVEERLQELYDRAVALVDEWAWFILAIAHALVARQTVSGDDIAAIANGSVGPTIDGAWYRNPVNRDAIWQFHLKAMWAHREQIVGWKDPVPPLPMVEAAMAGGASGPPLAPPVA